MSDIYFELNLNPISDSDFNLLFLSNSDKEYALHICISVCIFNIEDSKFSMSLLSRAY